MSSQEDEYIVEKILHHTEFDSLVRKALRSKAKFNPESIQDERRKHSKYAYLVAWEGYNLKDRTWEPEENLRDCVRLKEYKEAHNMPLEHEKFEKLYPAKTTRELGIAADDVTGIQWLMTKEEKDKRNEAKEKEKQEREAEEALRRKRKLERQKARAAAQQNGSEKPAEVASRKSSKSNGESSSTDHENNIKEKPYPVLPGIVSLDSNTPRIQKKSKVDESNGKPTTSTSMGPPLRVVLKTQSSNEPPSSKNPPIKLKLKKMPGGHYEHARPVQPPIVKASSLSNLAPQRAISQENDGPFREAVFFQCMRSGAECQKRLFFEFNKPIGSEEEPAGDYSCDAMHFLAVQYGNLQRFASYISLGGLDVNALATNTNTNRVIRLHEYLKEWIEKNVSDNQSTNEHKKYYKKMLEMVRLTAKSFHAFVSSEMNQMISKRLQERSKILMELTYPHVLRCSPYNNESVDGDGNQVLSCLFYPEHSGYKDGLDTIAVNEKDKENLKELKAIHQRFRKIVSEERGRLILALYRVNIKFAADITRKYELPIFEHERSDEGFKISRMT
ncbi:hypothetical protein CAEBREN_29947 [Caenorhabditis brenneri]|uniref:Chromo domain-containing protein n=1 Tax=Caenorhabditis brenneri TaxID=135651 RepID=G0PE70_CAEBE|nr:hypothetical protein CAEBREN_29947 [Caenorhabditis brenneri]